LILNTPMTLILHFKKYVSAFDVWLTVHRSSMWIKRPTRCHLVIYLFLRYNLLNMFRATLCPSSGADDLVVFAKLATLHVCYFWKLESVFWCSVIYHNEKYFKVCRIWRQLDFIAQSFILRWAVFDNFIVHAFSDSHQEEPPLVSIKLNDINLRNTYVSVKVITIHARFWILAAVCWRLKFLVCFALS